MAADSAAEGSRGGGKSANGSAGKCRKSSSQKAPPQNATRMANVVKASSPSMPGSAKRRLGGGNAEQTTTTGGASAGREAGGGGTGSGDMTKAEYDTDDDGVVDNSAALNGHEAALLAAMLPNPYRRDARRPAQSYRQG